MPEESGARYMPDRPSMTGIAIGAALILACIVVGALAAFAVVHLGSGGATPQQAARPGHPPPLSAPVVLQPAPGQDAVAFRADKRRRLESYGWVDAAHGIARIPIERAMALLAQQGEAGTKQ